MRINIFNCLNQELIHLQNEINNIVILETPNVKFLLISMFYKMKIVT